MKSLLFLLCASSALLGVDVPKWFSKPILEVGYFYGFGTDSSIESAKQKAMVDLSSSLQSNVQSNFQRETKRSDTTITSNASQTFNIHTASMDLMNVKTKYAECIEKNCYVVVEVSKNDLLNQIKHKIESAKADLDTLQSPFDYPYKKEKLYPQMLMDYRLYTALGGMELGIPHNAGEEPSFDVRFKYDDSFSNGFKGILEKTIEDALTRYGSITSSSDWKIDIEVFKENEGVCLEVSASYKGNVLHNASVFDTKKPSISNSFFAKRLGVQVYKKIKKWGKAL